MCLSRQRYNAIERDYRELHGDPHDPARALMWRSLKAIHADLTSGHVTVSNLAALAKLAIDTERATFTPKAA